MVKAKEQVPPAPPKKRSPLIAFIDHQITAVEETGKAVVSLLPKDFRDHSSKALEESKSGLIVLFDGALDTIESGLEKLRRKPEPKPEEAGKVKIDVE